MIGICIKRAHWCRHTSHTSPAGGSALGSESESCEDTVTMQDIRKHHPTLTLFTMCFLCIRCYSMEHTGPLRKLDWFILLRLTKTAVFLCL